MSEAPGSDMASEEQLAELRSLAPDDEVPDGMRAVEAEQRLTELRSQSGS